MQTFTHVIATDGLRTTVAGRMAQHARAYKDTTVSISDGTKTAKATQLLRLLSLNFERGHEVTVRAEGPHEGRAIADMHDFFQYYI